ncbi:T3SS regulon translocated regulator ExsE2 [Vibrio cortegadensis]|uniref:T3SS regulon translocated regulator ExsE2 n=2 Tax=Vibrionaceae TaxID=641 RepID=A0ABV4MC15_9VIBR
MFKGIQSTAMNSSIDRLEHTDQPASVKQCIFLGRTVVQINPKERVVNRVNSKLELIESLSMVTNVGNCNSILIFEKDSNVAQVLLNRKVQVLN